MVYQLEIEYYVRVFLFFYRAQRLMPWVYSDEVFLSGGFPKRKGASDFQEKSGRVAHKPAYPQVVVLEKPLIPSVQVKIILNW